MADMIRFLLKKYLYDLWDNLFAIMITNFLFLSLMVLFLFPLRLFPESSILRYFFFALPVFIGSLYLAALTGVVKDLSDYKSFKIKTMLKSLQEYWRRGAVLAVLLILLGVISFLIVPFYLQGSSAGSLAAGAILFWLHLLFWLILQFFLSLSARVESRVRQTFKNCLLMFFDNTPFALFTALYQVILLVISLLTMLLIPGPVGILLFLDEAVRLRLLKYAWLEENPGADRKHVPWETLLEEEREKTGSRSFKSFIFPWKD